MPEPIAKLLASASDSDLCGGIWDHIVAFHGEPDPSELPEPERVVLLVYHTYGIIGNGGFNYPFEGELPGDPDYSLSAEAYELIDCKPAAAAFRRALALFPGSTPPRDMSERLRLYRRGSGARRGQNDSQFFEAGDDIEACLARYIRAHADSYRHLEGSKPKRRPRTKPPPEPDDRQPDPVAIRMKELPHWARVAFAAHCARLVYPFFSRFWPDAAAERPLAIARAAQLAERSAEAGAPVEGLKDAEGNALQTAGAALIALYGYPNEGDEAEPLPPDGNTAMHASVIAKSAEFAARAANTPAKDSHAVAQSAYAWARDVATALDDWELFENMQRDFERLWRMARRAGWTDSSPITAEVFDPDYEPPAAKKPWWKFW
jgi:hypothetical protein